MSEKLNKMLEESSAREHGVSSFRERIDPLDSRSGNRLEDSDGHSDREQLAFMSSLTSEADHQKNVAEQTGTINPDKQKLVRELQRYNDPDEVVQERIGKLADEPDTIKRVLEWRIRQSLGKNQNKNLSSEQLHTDLQIINSALEHGIDVGAMRVDSDPIASFEHSEKPVGKWLDQLAGNLNVLRVQSVEDPDKQVSALEQITEIRNKLKDPEETPEEKEQREREEAETKAREEEEAQKQAQRQEQEHQARSAAQEIIERQRKAAEAESEAKWLGHKIKSLEDSIAGIIQEETSLKGNLGFFQQRFGKGKKDLVEIGQRKAAAQQELAKLKEEQNRLVTIRDEARKFQ